jgi:hypothetical protein
VPLPKLDRLLAAEGELQPLVAKARQIGALARLVDGFLPPDLARQVRVANLREGRLVLLAATPAAAAKLRLLAESLSGFLLQQRAQVSAVSVRVQPIRSQPSDGAVHKRARLSPAGLAELRALYERMRESPARAALRALLEHHAPPPTPAKRSARARPARRAGR